MAAAPPSDADRLARLVAEAVRAAITAAEGQLGTVYLLCFDRPYVSVSGNRVKRVRHYIGWTELPLDERLAVHRAGRGARLLEVITEAGIGFQAARTWEDVPQWWERRLKDRKNAALFCLRCDPVAAPRRAIFPADRVAAPAPELALKLAEPASASGLLVPEPAAELVVPEPVGVGA